MVNWPFALRKAVLCSFLILSPLKAIGTEGTASTPVGKVLAPPVPATLFSVKALPEKLQIEIICGGMDICQANYTFQHLPKASQYQVSGKKLTEGKTLADIFIRNIFNELSWAQWKTAQHPDDTFICCDRYLTWRLSFQNASQQKIEVISHADEYSHVPWNLQIDENLYVADSDLTSDRLYQAMHTLLRQLEKSEPNK